MNCIDCENLIKWGKNKLKEEIFTQCEYANENVKECMYFKNAKRKKTELGVVHIDMDYKKEVKEMLE